MGGDAIYNGAIDNATGCAMLLELARVWGALPQKPRRSVLLLAVTAEEGGLQGLGVLRGASAGAGGEDGGDSEFRRALSVGTGREPGDHGRGADQHLSAGAADCRRLDLAIAMDAHPEAGHYFRSDHFPMAHASAFRRSASGHATRVSRANRRGSASRRTEEYNSKHYHQPSDEFQTDWDFTALRQAAEFGFLLGKDIANQDKLPDWRPGDAFHR